MDAHGWGNTAEKLYRMSVEGRWSGMRHEVTDEMLDAFAVTGTFDDIVERVRARYASYAGSITLSVSAGTRAAEERIGAMIRELQTG